MNYNEISRIVLKELNKSGYTFKETRSLSTNSIYYKIFSGKESLIFRISDHKARTSIITFRMDRKNTYENLTQFVKNRVKDLSYRSVKGFLGL